jgi:predicted Zn finger-like uncharacterized protein
MPILIQCSSCQRKLRVQDHLLGKTVKCPNCQTKFQAKNVDEAGAAPTPPSADTGAAPPTPAAPTVKTLELPEPALAPTTPPPRTAERVKATAPPAPPATVAAPAAPPPAPPVRHPPPFPTPPLRVFGILGAVLLLTLIFGLGLSWAISTAVRRGVEARQTTPATQP